MPRLLILALLLSACTSTPLTLPTQQIQPHEEPIGTVSGSAGGFMLFHFIPIGHNDRFERAYQDALSRSGATRIINPTLSESWYFAYVGNGYITRVEGLGVRHRREAIPPNMRGAR